MDFYLNEKNYTNSAQVAVEVMLQEFNDNQITMALNLFSCWKYVNNVNEIISDDEPVGEASKSDAKVVCNNF
jgi:hypothetical protein